jgi:chemotaxis protein MotA
VEAEADYRDLLSLLFLLTKTMKSKGVIALESHIEKPHESTIFARYPKITHDHFAVDFICDTLRMMTMNLEDPHQVEDAMEKQLEKHHHEALEPAHALQSLADALPALGIVAAVLGVIKTMGSITEPPAVLGGMIGGALVGTFLGVFMAYGLVGPFATRLTAVVNEDGSLLQDHPGRPGRPPARQRRPDLGRDRPRQRAQPAQPSFAELEEALGADPERVRPRRAESYRGADHGPVNSCLRGLENRYSLAERCRRQTLRQSARGNLMNTHGSAQAADRRRRRLGPVAGRLRQEERRRGGDSAAAKAAAADASTVTDAASAKDQATADANKAAADAAAAPADPADTAAQAATQTANDAAATGSTSAPSPDGPRDGRRARPPTAARRQAGRRRRRPQDH